MPRDLLPHLEIRPDDVAPAVLVVGDPARAARAATRLEGAEKVGSNREYDTWTGSSGGVRLSVCSHGVGSAGAAICFEELVRAGVEIVIRAGTCGALEEEIADGDLIVATAAVKDDGVSTRVAPPGYPAAADHRIVAALLREAERLGGPVHQGIALATDVFYPTAAMGWDWRRWQTARVKAVEMELAALYVLAALHGFAAGGILTADGHPARGAGDMEDYDPRRDVVRDGVERMLDVAVAALVALAG